MTYKDEVYRPKPPKKFSWGMWTAIILELLMLLNLCTTLPAHATQLIALGLAALYARFTSTLGRIAILALIVGRILLMQHTPR